VRQHEEFLQGDAQAFKEARSARVRQEFLDLLKEGVFRHLLRQLKQNGRLDRIMLDILARQDDPYSASEALILEILGPAGS
jgi:hypothetical protein